MIYPYMTLADATEIVYTNVFEEFLHNNAHLFYKYGASGGMNIA